MTRRLALLAALPLVSIVACSSADEAPADVADHHDHTHEGEADENVGQTSAALVGTDPVEAAVAQSCSTTAVKGLATQLIEEVQCLKPGTLMKIDGLAGFQLGAAVFPYLQTPAAQALIAAQKARGTTMSINSALRALPQQYLLYRWYRTGRCGISLAASPGTSNHEGALAVDINDNAGWRSAMLGKNFRWLGANDPVHYDFTGNGRVSFNGLSVMAFQRLWNRNHPNDKIAEDGSYGPATESRLAKSPVGGFAMGANCKDKDGGVPEAGPEPAEVPVVPDGDEPAAPSGNDDGKRAGNAPPAPAPSGERPAAADGGCSSVPAQSGSPGAWLVGAALAAVFVRARRRQR